MKLWTVPILTLVFATHLYSQEAERVATETRISKQSTTENGDRGLFTVPSAETLNKGQFSAGIGWANSDRSPRDVDITALPVFFSIGVLGRLTVTGHFDARREIAARFLSQSGFNNQYPFVNRRYVADHGDTTLAAKLRLLRQRDNIGGMSVRGYVKVPTADEVKGLGTGSTDVGADLIFTSKLPLNVVLDSAIGFTWTEKVTDPVTNLKHHLKDQIRSGLGLAWPAAGIDTGGRLQAIAEYSTLTFVGAGTDNAAQSTESPSDLTGGVRYLLLGTGMTLTAGYRTNTKFDRGFPGSKDWKGFTASVSFTKPVRPPSNNRFPVVSLESSAAEIRAGDSATITATGYDADNDRLTYSWSSSGGRLNAEGAKATFSTAGLTPGKYTIRATASDGKGGSATSLIDVTVRP
jgi:PKD domain